MFVLKIDDKVRFTVQGTLADAQTGRAVPFAFKLDGARLRAEEVRTLAQDANKTVADVLADKITGWADVADETGQPVPYSADALRQMLDTLGLAPLVLQAYIEASGAKAKN